MESAETGLPARRTPSRPGQILSWDPWQPCRVPALGHPRSPHSAPAIFPRHFSSSSPKSEGNTATGGRESRPQMSVLHFKEGWKGLWGEKVSDLFWLRLEKTSWEGNNAAAKSRPLSGRNSRPLPEVPGGLSPARPHRWEPARDSPGHTRAPWAATEASTCLSDSGEWHDIYTETPPCQNPQRKGQWKCRFVQRHVGWTIYTISHTTFITCRDRADYCADKKIGAQWQMEVMKWPPNFHFTPEILTTAVWNTSLIQGPSMLALMEKRYKPVQVKGSRTASSFVVSLPWGHPALAEWTAGQSWLTRL